MKCWLTVGAMLAVLTGCSTTGGQSAPVVNLMGANTVVPTSVSHAVVPPVAGGYVIQKGDTLYSIALEHGVAYRDIADWNHLTDINHIQVGNTLRMTAPGQSTGVASASDQAQTTPMHLSSVNSQTTSAAMHVKNLPNNNLTVTSDGQAAPVNSTSNNNMAVGGATTSSATTASTFNWIWPTAGKVISQFNDTTANSKGIDIAGVRGQAIVAVAAGKVVYSGSGLHGYGNLVIIKHDERYLTAYAHNQTILVKEGQTVSQGQTIAEMGDSDATRVELHFEVRDLGKPIDPLKFLPAQQS